MIYLVNRPPGPEDWTTRLVKCDPSLKQQVADAIEQWYIQIKQRRETINSKLWKRHVENTDGLSQVERIDLISANTPRIDSMETVIQEQFGDQVQFLDYDSIWSED